MVRVEMSPLKLRHSHFKLNLFFVSCSDDDDDDDEDDLIQIPHIIPPYVDSESDGNVQDDERTGKFLAMKKLRFRAIVNLRSILK